MLKYIFNLYFILSLTILIAQERDEKSLKNDKNLIYLGEFSHYITFDNDTNNAEYNKFLKALAKMNHIPVISNNLKKSLDYTSFLNSESLFEQNISSNNHIGNLVHENLSKMNLFKDQALKISIEKKSYEKGFTVNDTIITFDPKSFSEIMFTPNYELKSKHIFIFKVIASAYLNVKEQSFHYYPKAIAVNTIFEVPSGQIILIPQFWMPVEINKNVPDLSKPSYLSANRIVHAVNEFNFNWNDTIYKNNFTSNIRKYLEGLSGKGSSEENEIISNALKPSMVKGYKKVTNSGNTSKEVKKEEFEYNQNEIKTLSFECIWSFNNATKKIECCPIKIYFLKNTYDSEGKPVGTKNVFWQKKMF